MGLFFLLARMRRAVLGSPIGPCRAIGSTKLTTITTMIGIVRAALVLGLPRDQVVAMLDACAPDAQPSAVPAAPHAPVMRRNGAAPSVKYQMVGKWTPAKLAERLRGRKLEVASLVLAHNTTGITKREILAIMQAADPSVTNGAVMSALAPLGSVMGIIKSIPIGPTRLPAKPIAKVSTGKVR